MDTVTILGPGDTDKCEDPLAIDGLAPRLIGLTEPTDFIRGDIGLASWLPPGDIVPTCKLVANWADLLAPFNASFTRAVTACGDDKPRMEAPMFCPGMAAAPIGLAATAALSWCNAAARGEAWEWRSGEREDGL